MSVMTTNQLTIYCGKPHRILDGAPVAHPCRILYPEYLIAEYREDYLYAASILQQMPLVLHGGVPGEHRSEHARDEAPDDMLDGDLGDPRGRGMLRTPACEARDHQALAGESL